MWVLTPCSPLLVGVEGFDHFGAATMGASAISGVALPKQKEEVKEWEGEICLCPATWREMWKIKITMLISINEALTGVVSFVCACVCIYNIIYIYMYVCVFYLQMAYYYPSSDKTAASTAYHSNGTGTNLCLWASLGLLFSKPSNNILINIFPNETKNNNYCLTVIRFFKKNDRIIILKALQEIHLKIWRLFISNFKWIHSFKRWWNRN